MSQTDLYGLKHLDSVRELIEMKGYVGRERPEWIERVRKDYEEFSQDYGDSAPLQFMASSGMTGQDLDERTGDRVFEPIRDALGSEKTRTSMILERITTGDWQYEGVSETELREAYENLDASLEHTP